MSRDEKKLVYAATHEWVDVQGSRESRIATVGISAFAIEQLNDLVYMDLPQPGRVLAAGEEFGEVESVKAVSPLYAPVSGEIVEVHSDLPENLDQLKDDPYDYGWILKIKLSGDAELGGLLDYETYQKQCAESG